MHQNIIIKDKEFIRIYNMDYFRKMISKSGIKAEPLSIIDQNNYLLNLKTDANLEEFGFRGFKTWAKCMKVISADSLVLALFYNNKPYKFNVRLAELFIPNPESQNSLETRIAKLTLQRVKDLVEDKLVFVECLDGDQVLQVRIFRDNIATKSINKQLIDDGLASDRRVPFKEWFEKGNKN